jgi:hypothetical protein
MLGMVGGGMIVYYFGYLTAFLICGACFFSGGMLTLLFVEENFVPPVKSVSAVKQKRKLQLPDFRIAGWLLLVLMFLVPVARRCDEPFLTFLVENIGGKERAELNTSYVTAMAALGGMMGEDAPAPPPSPPPAADMGVDMAAISKILPLLGNLNQENEDTRLLAALRPYLHGQRAERLEESMRLMKLMQLLPLLTEGGRANGG